MKEMKKNSNEVWVLGETDRACALRPTVFELSAKARELADALEDSTGEAHAVAVVFLSEAETGGTRRFEEVGVYGADLVYVVRAPNLVADRAAGARVLAHLASRRRPQIVLASATAYGRAVMPYAAALLETGLTADCTGLAIEPGSNLLLQTRPAIGGNIMATIKTPEHRPQMATVRPRTFRTPEPVPGRAARVEEPDVSAEILRSDVRMVSFTPFAEESGTLQDRDVVVSGGKGLRRAEGFELLSRLAALLNAGVGASRPVVEMRWIGYPHQVGLSGQVVTPKVYIAAGISGSVQHLAGMQTAGKIVAINRDPDAPIFNASDVALCGDLYEIVPKLIEKIEKKIGEKSGAR